MVLAVIAPHHNHNDPITTLRKQIAGSRVSPPPPLPSQRVPAQIAFRRWRQGGAHQYYRLGRLRGSRYRALPRSAQ